MITSQPPRAARSRKKAPATVASVVTITEIASPDPVGAPLALPPAPSVAPDDPSTAVSGGPGGPASTPPTPPTPDELFLSKVDNDLNEMEGQLAALRTQRDQIEADHVTRGKTQLSLRLERVGCQLTSERWPGGQQARDVPEHEFQGRLCPYGKTVPDQDCRSCRYVKILPVSPRSGARNERTPDEFHRFPEFGPILPLTEEQAETLAHFMKALGVLPLRRVDQEIKITERAITNARAMRDQARQREMERLRRR